VFKFITDIINELKDFPLLISDVRLAKAEDPNTLYYGNICVKFTGEVSIPRDTDVRLDRRFVSAMTETGIIYWFYLSPDGFKYINIQE
jgi:hypothetical protein